MVWPDRSPDPPPPQHIEYTQLAPPLNTHRLSKMRIRSMNLCPCRRSPNHSLRKMRTQPARRSPPGRLRTQLRERSLYLQNLPHSPHTLQSQLPSWKSPQRTPCSCWIRPRASLRSPRHRGMLRSRWPAPRRCRCPCRSRRGTTCRRPPRCSRTCPRRNSGTQSPHLRRGHTCRPRKLQEQQTAVKVVQNSADGRG